VCDWMGAAGVWEGGGGLKGCDGWVRGLEGVEGGQMRGFVIGIGMGRGGVGIVGIICGRVGVCIVLFALD